MLVKKYKRSKITMIFQTFLIISIVIAANYSAKIDENNYKYEELSNIDCDSLYIDFGDSYLGKLFLKHHDLQSYFEKRNQNYMACLNFLDRFLKSIEQYKKEKGTEIDFKMKNKKSNKINSKSILPFKHFY